MSDRQQRQAALCGDPIRALLAAMIYEAALEARGGGRLCRVPAAKRAWIMQTARTWLDNDGAALAEAIFDIRASTVRAWVSRLDGNGDG